MRYMYYNSIDKSLSSIDLSAETTLSNDPFYDRFSWFPINCHAHVYLNNLFYNIPLLYNAAIVSEKGIVKEWIKVTVQSINGKFFNHYN